MKTFLIQFSYLWILTAFALFVTASAAAESQTEREAMSLRKDTSRSFSADSTNEVNQEKVTPQDGLDGNPHMIQNNEVDETTRSNKEVERTRPITKQNRRDANAASDSR